MKKFITSLLLTTSIVLLTSSFPFSKLEETNNVKIENKSEEISPIMTLEQIVKMTNKEFSALKGSNMSLKEKLVLKITQRQLKKEIKAGRVSNDEELDIKAYMAEEMPKFNVGGFILGFLLGLIGVGLAHIFSNNKNFRRSSWYGFGAWIILVLIFALV